MEANGGFGLAIAVAAIILAGGCAKTEEPKPPVSVKHSSWTQSTPSSDLPALPALQTPATRAPAPVPPAMPMEHTAGTSWDAAVPGSMASFRSAIDRCDALQGTENTVCRNKAESELASR
jgi:hypothetical protein